jgi:hypothetical protein
MIKNAVLHQLDGVTIRGQLLMLIGEALLLFVVWLFLLKKKNTPVRRLAHYYLLMAYAGFILSVTILRRPPGSRERIMHLYIDIGLHNRGYWLYWCLLITFLNVLLFIPWGMIVASFSRDKKWFKRILITTIIGFLTSLIVECIQYKTGTGYFELTDLMTNSIGTFIGAVLAIPINRLFRG